MEPISAHATTAHISDDTPLQFHHPEGLESGPGFEVGARSARLSASSARFWLGGSMARAAQPGVSSSARRFDGPAMRQQIRERVAADAGGDCDLRSDVVRGLRRTPRALRYRPETKRKSTLFSDAGGDCDLVTPLSTVRGLGHCTLGAPVARA